MDKININHCILTLMYGVVSDAYRHPQVFHSLASPSNTDTCEHLVCHKYVQSTTPVGGSYNVCWVWHTVSPSFQHNVPVNEAHWTNQSSEYKHKHGLKVVEYNFVIHVLRYRSCFDMCCPSLFQSTTLHECSEGDVGMSANFSTLPSFRVRADLFKLWINT